MVPENRLFRIAFGLIRLLPGGHGEAGVLETAGLTRNRQAKRTGRGPVGWRHPYRTPGYCRTTGAHFRFP